MGGASPAGGGKPLEKANRGLMSNVMNVGGGRGKGGATPRISAATLTYLCKVDPLARLIEDQKVQNLYDVQAHHYYSNDLLSGKNGMPNSYWFGKGAKSLGLEGKVADQVFQALRMGLDPTGQQPMVHEMAFRADRRHGYDFVFKPPKSVSVAALHLADQRIHELHDRAVKEALTYAEDNLVYYRKTNHHRTQTRKSDNILVAVYNHTLSRELDPHLHSHAFILNLTDVGEPTWKSLVNDAVYQAQATAKSIYQATMAKGLTELGYEIDTKPNGHWEIQGIQQDQLDRFSKRSWQIKNHMDHFRARNIMPGAGEQALRNAVQVYTKKPKQDGVSPAQLLRSWDIQVPKAKLAEQLRSVEPSRHEAIDMEQLVTRVADRFTQFQTNFSKLELINQLLSLHPGKVVYQDLIPAIDALVEKGELLDFSVAQGKPNLQKKEMTTKAMFDLERQVEKTFVEGKNQHRPYLPAGEVETKSRALNSEFRLNRGQSEAVKLLLCSKDRYGLIQGDAGTGKTTAIDSARQVLEASQKELSKPVELIGLGFTGRSVTMLKEAGKIQAHTIDGFLRKPEFQPGNKVKTERCFIIDESSMVSSRHFFDLVERVEALQARAVFVGDGKQLQAIGAGKLFRDLQDRQGTGVRLTEVIRQKNEDLKLAVSQVKDYMEDKDKNGIHKTFALLEQKGLLHSFPTQENLHAAVVERFTREREKQDLMIVTPENKDRIAINEQVRTALKESGRLSGKEILKEVRFPVNLHHFQIYDAQNYPKGDRVFLKADVGKLKAGKELEITGQDVNHRAIFLEGRPLSLLEHAKDISLFKVHQKAFAQGEKIVFLKNDSKLKVENGLTAVITSINKERVEARKQDGGKVSFSTKEYQYFDHGYATTVYKAQGATCDQALLVTGGKPGPSTNAETLYTSLTRARYKAEIYTDNPDLNKLSKTFGHAQEKTSTLELEAECKRAEQQNRAQTREANLTPQPNLDQAREVGPEQGMELGRGL